MTGTELLNALERSLRDALPEIDVRRAFSGKLTRRPEKPVAALGILAEEYGEEGYVKLGVWLYTKPGTDECALFSAVCGAVWDVPCEVKCIARGGTAFNAALGCMETACAVTVAAEAAEPEKMKLRFGDFEFPTNPAQLHIELRALLRESVSVCGETAVHAVGQRKKRVRGSGAFTGEDAEAVYRALETLFGEEHTLFLPGREPIKAVLSELMRSEVQEKNAVGYSFVFTETAGGQKGASGRTYLAKAGESLWDYAYFAGVPIDALVKANRHIACITELKAGEAVKIP